MSRNWSPRLSKSFCIKTASCAVRCGAEAEHPATGKDNSQSLLAYASTRLWKGSRNDPNSCGCIAKVLYPICRFRIDKVCSSMHASRVQVSWQLVYILFEAHISRTNFFYMLIDRYATGNQGIAATNGLSFKRLPRVIILSVDHGRSIWLLLGCRSSHAGWHRSPWRGKA